jgi:TRAP-type C4-dicarboxylate transport system substrate-binding protein
MRALLSMVLISACLLAVPGGPRLRAENQAKVLIKVSTLQARSPENVLEDRRVNERLTQATEGRVQVRRYYGGTQGDDKTAFRKMRAGQIDGAILGVDIVSQAVRQCTVTMAPQTFSNWKQVDAARVALQPEFDEEAYRNGFKVIGWFDLGQARIFSKKPISSFEDLRKARDWLYPENAPLKMFYQMINVTGIPLDLNEVYGGLSTNIIDVVWISPMLGAQLMWVSKTQFVSAESVTVIQGAFLLRRELWDGLSKADQDGAGVVLRDQLDNQRKKSREDDVRVYDRLLARGVKAVPFDKPDVWREVGRQISRNLIGRSYTKEIYERVQSIVKANPDTQPVAAKGRS